MRSIGVSVGKLADFDIDNWNIVAVLSVQLIAFSKKFRGAN